MKTSHIEVSISNMCFTYSYNNLVSKAITVAGC